ncbi:hypothetical protein [Aquidulcibacter sp.]|jgi:hypothetical protein|uniref:hypothetical protein n=1 Tax=Aquidulcibacter sp. TaxID=2052990 RepID=UPI0037C0F2F4
MMNFTKLVPILSIFLSLLIPAMPLAAEPAAQATAPVESPAAAPAASIASIPAGTPMDIEITELLSTKTSKVGDRFALKLAQPLKIGDKIVVPAGILGTGEVIDVGKPGIGGKPGKLVIAGRFLTLNGTTIGIRGLQLRPIGGEDRSNVVMATSFVPYLGMASFLIQGGHVEIPAGAWATAKLTAPFVPAAAATAP